MRRRPNATGNKFLGLNPEDLHRSKYVATVASSLLRTVTPDSGPAQNLERIHCTHIYIPRIHIACARNQFPRFKSAEMDGEICYLWARASSRLVVINGYGVRRHWLAGVEAGNVYQNQHFW
jgi:hypothetical protein